MSSMDCFSGGTQPGAGASGGGPTGILGPYATTPAAQAGLVDADAGDVALVSGESGGNDYSARLQKGASSDQIQNFYDFSVGSVATPPMAEGGGFDTFWGNPPAFTADGLLIDPLSNVVFDLGEWVGHTRRVVATVLLTRVGASSNDHYVAAGLAANGDTIAACGGLLSWSGTVRMAALFSVTDLTAKLSRAISTSTSYQMGDLIPLVQTEYKLRMSLLRRGNSGAVRDTQRGGGSKGTDTGVLGANQEDYPRVHSNLLVERATAGRLMVSHAWPNVTMILKDIAFMGVKNG